MKELRFHLEKMVEFLGLDLNKLQINRLIQYVALLLEGTKKQRLVGEKDGVALIEKQLPDALYPLKLNSIVPGPLQLLDLGTGGGLPGIPLKISLPEIALTLMDANRRKINFTRRVAAELGLGGVQFIPGRAEKWGRQPGCRENFDCVVSRAVAKAAVVVELGLPLVKKGGTLLLYKGRQGADEIAEAATPIQLCGGRLERCWHYRLPTGEKRTLFRIIKEKETPLRYPRRIGKPSQRPLGR
ncbi:MAG: 16S rRNA (guanine(527)-N(7))-methyltransferase RsmG [Firmicutes bacterium]|nr:16S rRNA (guanine(527)-N(7))-methyltransferase RsmG [Bacillota bacterium]